MSFIGKGGNRSLIGLKPVEKYGYEVTYMPFWLSIPIPATVALENDSDVWNLDGY
jgi:hypothetical protein